MPQPIKVPFKPNLSHVIIWAVFLSGLYLIVIRAMGPGFELMPGDLGDNRLNNHILEHFYRWILGLDRSYWNAAFFYPYPLTMAFGDNLLGAAAIYALFRRIGFDPMSSFQGWYVLGYFLNYAAAVYVLSKLKFNALAASGGAFFFTFGLPLLAQENHAQLIYRFCVPLACYMLRDFYQEPKITKLPRIFLWVAWQFYLTIYVGIFLLFVLAALLVLCPVLDPQTASLRQKIAGWPVRLGTAWSQSAFAEKRLALVLSVMIGAAFVALLWPYLFVSRMYGFSRSWDLVSSMLPRPQSYLLADSSLLWRSVSTSITDIPRRHEHQLFTGIAVFILLVLGIFDGSPTNHRGPARINLWVIVLLTALTLNLNGFSLYRPLSTIPGLDSLRAISRIQVVLMWPLSVMVASALHSLLSRRHRAGWFRAAAFCLLGLMAAESALYDHVVYPKSQAEIRLEDLRRRLPASLPPEPILFVAQDPEVPAYLTNLDAMLLAQESGWATINGYTGNIPPGYENTSNCKKLPVRIKIFMEFSGIQDEAVYFGLMERAVPIGFDNCDPRWWERMP